MKSRNKDHKPHESIIGKIIYGFLLFMPLLAIGVTCAYAIFNKNAYQSYGDNYVEKNITIQNQNDANTFYLDGQNVTWYLNNNAYGSRSSKYGFSEISLDLNTLFNTQDIIYNGFEFYTSAVNFMYFYDSNGTQYQLNNYKNDFSTFTYTIDLDTYNSKPLNTTYGNFVITLLTPAPLTNVFYYSIDKVQQSPLFNWAKDSLIYTGMTNTCNALNITTPFIPLLMTYWLIISVIYILYDIILVILHIFHKKIHQLEDSF